jgi:hypothetical protein
MVPTPSKSTYNVMLMLVVVVYVIKNALFSKWNKKYIYKLKKGHLKSL